MVSHIYKYTSKCHSQAIPSSEIRYPGPGNVFSTLWWQANPSLWHRALKPSSPSVKPKGKGIDCSKMKQWAISTNLPVYALVRLPHLWKGDSQGHETLLAPPAGNQTRNCGIECSKHHSSVSTLRLRGLSGSNMKWREIYANLPVDARVSLHYPRSGDSEGKERFLADSADQQTRNSDIDCSNHHPSLSTLRLSGLRLVRWNSESYIQI